MYHLFTENYDSESSDADYVPTESSENENSGDELLSFNLRSKNHEMVEDFNNNIESAPQQKRKKKTRNPTKWQKIITKNKVNRGESYVTSTFKIKDSKRSLGGCNNANCSFECEYRITNDEQNDINKVFWNLGGGDAFARKNFIINNTEEVVSEYRYPTSNRNNNYKYFLPINEDQIRVCKVFFMNTLNISDKLIRNVFKNSDRMRGFVGCDNRGRGHHYKITDSLKQSCRDHINSFPRIESHYLRKQTTREYIEGDLSVAEMYRLYVKQRKDENLPFVKKSMYYYIFNTEFAISFFKPKKDQCDLCTKYKNADEAGKASLQSYYESHHRNKNQSRVEKSNDITYSQQNPKTLVGIYDLQAVLSVPCADTSSLYYKRKLNCYNFTVYNCTDGIGTCFFWNESIALRGVNEISSCVYDFLEKNCKGYDSVTMFSDNCTGQNKNKTIPIMYMYAVQNLNIKIITHKFLIAGHTQNEGDSMHSLIEKAKKRYLNKSPIYSPSQWPMILRLAKKNGEPYKVNELNYTFFSDFKEKSSRYFADSPLNEDGEKFLWNEVRVIEIRSEQPGMIFYKTDYEQDSFKRVNVLKKQMRSCSLLSINDVKKYSSPKSSLSKEKLKDLLYICSEGIIPSIYHEYYFSLCMIEEELRLKPDESDDDF